MDEDKIRPTQLREKLDQKEEERQQREPEKAETMKPGGMMPPVNNSVAAQRQAKAKGSGKGQYGPTDEEVADMLYNNRTPSPQAPTP